MIEYDHIMLGYVQIIIEYDQIMLGYVQIIIEYDHVIFLINIHVVIRLYFRT